MSSHDSHVHDTSDTGEHCMRPPSPICAIAELNRSTLRSELATVSLLDALDVDIRPSFAIQAASDAPPDVSLHLVYSNAALCAVDGLLAAITGQHKESSIFAENTAPQTGFARWLLGTKNDFGPARGVGPYIFEGFVWTAMMVEQFTIVSGLSASLLYSIPSRLNEPVIDPKELKPPNNAPVQGRPPTLPAVITLPHQSELGEIPSMHRETSGRRPYDVTMSFQDGVPQTAHIQYFRSIDWRSTCLGAMDTWRPELRSVVNITLANTRPTMLLWGNEYIMIYNEAYVELLGTLHPCMGQSARTAASDYWHTFQPLVDHIDRTGQAVYESEIPVFIDRFGFLEETYWSFQFIPVLNSEGCVAGYYHPLVEITNNHLLERRVSSLVELGSEQATGLQSFWDLALRTLASNGKDVPLALIYSAQRNCLATNPPAVTSPGGSRLSEQYYLQGAIGVDEGSVLAPPSISLAEDKYALQQSLLEASESKKVVTVHLQDLSTANFLFSGIDWKGFKEPSRLILVCPIVPTTGDQVEGFLILGTNPRRPFDQNYQQFIHVMLRLLSTSLASVVLFEEEVRLKEKAMVQAAALQEQLVAELERREKKFQRYAERSDVAIFTLSPEGKYLYRNQRWHDMFQVDVEDAMGAWHNIVFPEDFKRCEGIFMTLVVDKVPINFELQTKIPWYPPPELAQPDLDTKQHFHWVLCSAYPELGPNGELIEVVGNVTDISKQKWVEDVQRLRTDSALESKLHIEHFIDTTSHEMRNPLSAIMQCADGILTSQVGKFSHQLPSAETWATFVEQTTDAARTIAQCTQHMRHIVDDILTISKLDSGLLVITPVDTQPESVLEHAVKMFEAEAKAADVRLSFEVEKSYHDLNVDWVSLDPTRILQILINLLTNAIKFTRLEPVRHVKITLGASTTPPASEANGIIYNADKLVAEDHHLREDWKHDPHDLFYIQFRIIDTGRGLSAEEKGNLFNRFSQASPRTHIHYGGSGLGLFISRRLTELQGGAIGLASEPKRGSTFAFYVKTRRSKPMHGRKGSLPNVFPEDIRYRSQTPMLPRRISSPKNLQLLHGRLEVHGDAKRPLPSRQPSSPSQELGNMAVIGPSQGTANAPTPVAGREPDVQSPALQSNQPTPTEDAPSSLHVLVVEDNLVNQRVLAKQLRNLGCIVHVANHGREALEFLKKTTYWIGDTTSTQSTTPTDKADSDNAPALSVAAPATTTAALALDLILMDWEMPIMSGLAATTAIRSWEASGRLRDRLPVIGVTANVRPQQIETALAAGMDDVLGKPFRVAELIERMKRAVGGIDVAGDEAGSGGR